MSNLKSKRLTFNILSVSKTLLILLLFIVSSYISKAEISATGGEKLFKQYCVSCHKMDAVLVGPALKDVTKRRNEVWLKKWIYNNASLRASGDKDALAVWNEYGKNEMPSFTSLTDDDLGSLIKYFSDWTPPVATATDSSKPGGSTSSDSTSVLYVILIIFSVLVLVEAKVGQPVAEPFSLSHFLKQKSTIAAALLILIVLGGYTTVDKAQNLGRSKNYMPDQPIAFSHKLHAGINQIDCKYCHSGVEKSKHANIPSVNVCMNCHKAVQQGESEAGTAEIAKILTAYEAKKPIEWVKIHNTPDHVYFNHSQHVAVGKIECQKCHGPIQEMEKVYQFSSLSMGWCINCHRETKVQFTDNKYYSQFEKLHDDLKSGKIKEVTEGMMGGTECQKCHY